MARKRGPNVNPLPLVKALSDIIGERSIEEIGERVGLSQSSVGKWFNSRTAPSLANFEAVLNHLGYKLEIVKVE